MTTRTYITPHFWREGPGGLARGVEWATIPAAHQANLGRLAVLLEAFRKVLGVPLDVTNGYDAPTVPDPPGRVPDSQHKDGSAADVIAVGLSQLEAYRRILAAEKSPAGFPVYGQLIFYPFRLQGAGSGHLHISLANRDKRNQKLVRLDETAPDSAGQKYAGISAPVLSRFPSGSTSVAVLVVLLALLALFFLLAPEISRG